MTASKSGCIVNTVTQVTAEPPKVAVAVSKQNLTTSLIERSGLFNAVALTEEATMDLIGRFGFRSGREEDKFAGIPHGADANGVWYPTETASAMFSCKVIDKLDLDTHVLFVGKSIEAVKLSDAPVMTYDYYHKVKKGETPPNAPSYKKARRKTRLALQGLRLHLRGRGASARFHLPHLQEGRELLRAHLSILKGGRCAAAFFIS